MTAAYHNAQEVQGTIYALIDPRDQLPFYVGYTLRPLETRFLEHLLQDTSNHLKSDRIAELRELHLLPIIKEIEIIIGTLSEIKQRENYWIRQIGSTIPLLNRGRQDHLTRTK